MKPFVKWAGGKRQILSRITKYIEDSAFMEHERYVEPFLGGGAVFFHLHPKNAIINDLNTDLMDAYEIIKSDDYELLIKKLKEHETKYKSNDEDEYYYEVRAWDRNDDWPDKYSKVERAARMIFLNRTCYNGLYRVNQRGQFNTPIGRYSNPTICDETNIREIHDYLKNNNILIMNKSYQDVLVKCGEGDVIYIDPPYDYKDDDGFTKYQMAGFSFEDFEELKKYCDDAIDRGAFVIISNNATEKVLKLFLEDVKYTAYYPDTFQTLRSINCNGNMRKTGSEVIVTGVSYKIVPQANDMKKIINLACAGPNILKDKEFAKKIIEVSTDRQVAYYLSALEFFGYIISTKELSEKLKKLEFDKEKVADDIFNQLINNKDIKKFYLTESKKAEIVKELKNSYDNLSDATADRRASTIQAWVRWMKEHKKASNNC